MYIVKFAENIIKIMVGIIGNTLKCLGLKYRMGRNDLFI